MAGEPAVSGHWPAIFVVNLQARVVPPNAAGTVVFKDGNTPIAGPVPVIGGIAVGGLMSLPVGPHSVTAMFVPSNPAAFQPSTSAPPVTFTF